MAKQGQHKHDHHDPRVSHGPNNPKESVTITTGSVKTQETYEAQYRRHENPNKEAQRATNEWHSDTNATDPVSQRDETGGGKRSGSDSNA